MEYVVLCIDPVTSRVFFVNKDGKKSTRAPTGVLVRIPTDMARLSNLSYHEKASTVEVVAVPVNQTIPTPVINALPSGPIEYFSSAIGFHYQPNMPKGPTVAMLLNIHTGKYKSFQLVMGGSAMTATVPFGKLLGLEKRSAGGPESEFSVSINPADIQFPVNRAVSDFTPITEMFRGSLALAWT